MSLWHLLVQTSLVHTCCSPHRQKRQLSHGCCTAAALFLDPQEEVVVRSCSSGAREKPGDVGKSVAASVYRPSVDRLVGVLPSGESHCHC